MLYDKINLDKYFRKRVLNMSKHNLHQGHRDRLRKRFITLGEAALFEHELLELALFYPIPRINTNNIAHSLIEKFENLNGILDASMQELMEIKGIGESSAEFLCLLADICNEYSTFSASQTPVVINENISDYFRDYFLDSNSGVCLTLGIDDNFQVKNKISFTKDNLMNDNSEVRRIAEFLIKNNCTKIAIGINHPERPAIPDNSDFALIRLFAEKFSVFDIILIDCIICSNQDTFSVKQHSAFSFEV